MLRGAGRVRLLREHMSTLMVSLELGRSLLGALLQVARVDGVVCEEEADELNRLADELVGGINAQDLFFDEVSPWDLAAAIERHAAPGPYRSAPTSDPQEIAQAFLAAAERLAAADGSISDGEAQLIQTYAEALAGGGVLGERLSPSA